MKKLKKTMNITSKQNTKALAHGSISPKTQESSAHQTLKIRLKNVPSHVQVSGLVNPQYLSSFSVIHDLLVL